MPLSCDTVKVQSTLNEITQIKILSLFLGVSGSESLLAGGEKDSGTSGITVVTCNGSA